MKIVTIDGAKMTSKVEAHAHISDALDFPMYYGKNLDALADCLSEIPRETTIVLRNMDAARDVLGEYADAIFEVFEEIANNGVFRLVTEEAAETDESEIKNH